MFVYKQFAFDVHILLQILRGELDKPIDLIYFYVCRLNLLK